jgi:hypothetical protein
MHVNLTQNWCIYFTKPSERLWLILRLIQYLDYIAQNGRITNESEMI